MKLWWYFNSIKIPTINAYVWVLRKKTHIQVTSLTWLTSLETGISTTTPQLLHSPKWVWRCLKCFFYHCFTTVPSIRGPDFHQKTPMTFVKHPRLEPGCAAEDFFQHKNSAAEQNVLRFRSSIVICWVVPPPSNSHHQDCCVFSSGSL